MPGPAVVTVLRHVVVAVLPGQAVRLRVAVLLPLAVAPALAVVPRGLVSRCLLRVSGLGREVALPGRLGVTERLPDSVPELVTQLARELLELRTARDLPLLLRAVAGPGLAVARVAVARVLVARVRAVGVALGVTLRRALVLALVRGVPLRLTLRLALRVALRVALPGCLSPV
ncbi:hypothetical protein GCM10027601_12520 [Nocardioides ungokensis]